MINATAIVPYRGDTSGDRSRNVQVILRWLATSGLRVILVEHATHPDVAVRVPEGIHRIHLPSDGPFNKSAAINAAVIHSKTPALVLVDADTLVRPGVVESCVTRVLKDPESGVENIDGIRPFGYLVELSEEQSRGLADGGRLPEPSSDFSRSDHRGHELVPACGGIVVLKRSAFINAGGMDEVFEGWGGEDDALSCALERSGAALRILTNEPAFHLWHARLEQERYGHRNYKANSERAHWWRTAPTEEVQIAIDSGRDRFATLALDVDE